MSKTQSYIFNWENLVGLILGVFLVCCSILILPHLQSKNEASNEQIVAFEPSMYDFGNIYQAETIKHEFRLVNHSTNEIKIISLRTSCRCTIIEKDLTGKIIPPKGSINVPVEFYSGVDRGVGNAKVEALVENRSERFYAKAFIGGQVDPDFDFKPDSIDFGTLKPGQKVAKTISLIPRALTDFSVRQPESMGFYQIALITNIESFSQQSFTLQVTFNAPSVKYSKAFNNIIRVETSSKRVPVLTIPVTAVIQPELEVYPDVVIALPPNEIPAKSRFTIHTIQPSRIIHSFLTKNDIPIPGSANSPSGEDVWNTTHVMSIDSSSLSGADKITFELLVRNESGQTEAQSAFVQINRL